MNVLVLGGDKRYLEIINNFKEKNYNIDLVGYKNTIPNTNLLNVCDIDVCIYDIILFPISGVGKDFIIKGDYEFQISENFLSKVNENVLIFSGTKTPNLDLLLKHSNRGAIILMEDNDIIKSNAIPTVEGILADIIMNTDITIKNSNVLVIGYGNIGSYLVDSLKKLGSNVIVSIKENRDKTILDEKRIPNVFSSDKIKMNKCINECNIIINTVPTLIIDKEYIKNIRDDTYILDVSSYPHGIDIKELEKDNIKYKIYLGIPSKVAPKTSGLILTKKINTLIGG